MSKKDIGIKRLLTSNIGWLASSQDIVAQSLLDVHPKTQVDVPSEDPGRTENKEKIEPNLYKKIVVKLLTFMIKRENRE